MSTPQILQHLYSLDISSPDFLRYLYCLIQADEGEQYLTSLRGSDLVRLVDFLDETLDVTPIADDTYRRCLHKLQSICSHHTTLPSSYNVPGNLSRVGSDPVAFGGFSDVWEGTYCNTQVCIKYLRVSEQVREAVEKAFYKEAIIWKRLRHPNVVRFIGVTQNPLQFVSEWMPNGTLTGYVNKNPGVNRIGLLLDVAEGLNYLHSKHTTHGDLKGPNVLIDRSGHARLTDFGFASVVRGLHSVLVTQVRGYTPRWAAPEVLCNGDKNTREADVFAFGMVIIEVFTGEHPFSEFTPSVTIAKIIDGERPERPTNTGLTDPLWDMTRSCWHEDPIHRPEMVKVVGVLRKFYMRFATTQDPPTIASLQSTRRTISTRIFDHVAMPLGFEKALTLINEIAEELPDRKEQLMVEDITTLLHLCIRWHTVPTSYQLRGVVRLGDDAQCASRVTEIWKGMYNGEVVALKVLKLSRDNPEIELAKRRFCARAVLMKYSEYENILPFYGVLTTISDFSLVFPWYKNGNIGEYLKNNPHVDRYQLLLGAVNGLCILHHNKFIHGALRPSHILIDDHGNARLTIAAHDTSIKYHAQSSSTKDIMDYSYMAPEVRPSPEERASGTPAATPESDVYEMAVVIYEVLTGVEPYYERRTPDLAPSILVGETPVRPQDVISDRFWNLLEICWSRSAPKRPRIAEVHSSLSKLNSRPEVIYTPPVPPANGRFTGKLRLHIQSLKFPLQKPQQRQFCVKFKYGQGDYRTSRTKPVNNLGEHTWDHPENWMVEVDEQRHGRLVTVEVLTQTRLFKRDKVCATGNFSISNSTNKQIVVRLRVPSTGTGFVDLKILLMQM